MMHEEKSSSATATTIKENQDQMTMDSSRIMSKASEAKDAEKKSEEKEHRENLNFTIPRNRMQYVSNAI